mgnify:CR=1 FL=1
MILEELFPTVAEFRKYAPSAESNVSFQELNPSATAAKKQIVVILTRGVYNLIAQEEGELKNALRTAVANLTLGKQLIFDVISRRKSDIDIYKHEQESMRRAYIDNYYTAMDTIIQLLEEAEEVPQQWKDSRYRKLLESLRIKNTEEFDSLYPIDLSYLFFFRTTSIQKEALEEGLSSYYDRAGSREDILSMLDRCLAKQTISIALRRFDISEFPATIRNLFDDSIAGRSGKDEQEHIFKLSKSLADEVNQQLRDIDLMLTTDESGSVVTETSFNHPDDLIYLLG